MKGKHTEATFFDDGSVKAEGIGYTGDECLKDKDITELLNELGNVQKDKQIKKPEFYRRKRTVSMRQQRIRHGS